MTSELKPRSTRKAVGLLVKLAYQGVDDFVAKYATNLGEGGMFLRSKKPMPVGTVIQFKIEIAGGQRVLQGLATVKWIRAEATSPTDPAGMGVEFQELDETSQKLVKRMLALKGGSEEPATPPPPAKKPPPPAPKVPPKPEPKAQVKPEIDIAFDDEPLTSPPPADPEKEIDVAVDALLNDIPEPAAPAPELQSDRLLDSSQLGVDLEAPSFPPADEGLDLGLDLDLDLEALPELPPKPAAPPPAPKRPAPPPEAPPAQVSPSPAINRTRTAAPEAQAKPPPSVLEAPKAAPAKAVQKGPVYLSAPGVIEGTGPVIGIDLGTTNSCCAVLSNGKPIILRSKDGYNTIPSAVALSTNNKLLVGHRAKSQMLLNPSRAIYGAKRLVGRDYDSATVRAVRERFHYSIVPGEDGRAAVELGDSVLSLEEVQGIILRECKEMAEQHLNQKVSRAVVTCPAYYSEPQREAVRRAGAMAGLKVERIINEPTAAALAYGMNRQLAKTILVYDLGGGTFDATLMKIEGNVFEVLSTGGDIFLGGVDFDGQLTDVLLKKYTEFHKTPFSGDSIALSRVNDVAERAKVALSERASFDIHLPMLEMDPATGTPKDLKCTLTRAELEAACMDLVDRTLSTVQDVLLDAKVKPSEVDDIILAGGMSRLPLVRKKLETLFKKPAHASVNADEAVALGAALFSGTVDKVSSVVLIDVVPMTIGIGMPGGTFKRVIERNTPLPVSKSFGVSTQVDNQTLMELMVFQGEDGHVSANEFLGAVHIEGLPKAPKGAIAVAVTLQLDSECVLTVEAKELRSRKAFSTKLATRFTTEEIAKRLGIAADGAKKAETKREEELKSRGGGFWGKIKKVFKKK